MAAVKVEGMYAEHISFLSLVGMPIKNASVPMDEMGAQLAVGGAMRGDHCPLRYADLVLPPREGEVVGGECRKIRSADFRLNFRTMCDN